MRSGTASAFWRWRRRRLPGLARTPASTTSPKRQALERELCIATFLRETHSSKRSIGLKVERLAAAEKKFSESLPPIEALRAWMLLFVDYIATKQIIGPALNSLVGGPSKLYEGSRGQIQGAIDSLVKRAIKSGDIRRDLEPFDLLRALIGVSHVASGPDWQQSARRLVDILITGSRPIK